MKYVITGGAGNISLPLSLSLLKAGHEVTVIGRDASHLKQLTDAGAKAAIGSVEDVAFLTKTFTSADAVYTMVPPIFQVSDWKKYIASIGNNYAAAIKSSGVKHVVNLSSIGAHASSGMGPISGIHYVEVALNALTDVNIKHLRPSYFFTNLLANIGMIKHAGIIGANYSTDRFPMVSPTDIAAVASEELLGLSFTGHSVRYIVSDIVSTDEVASVLGSAIGKPDLKWIEFTDEQALNGMIQAGLPEEIAKNYSEMNQSVRSGSIFEDYFKHDGKIHGKIKLEDFSKDFAAAYKADQ